MTGVQTCALPICLLGYYEKAFKNAQYAVEGDNRKGFTGIVCGQISTYNPEIANIVDGYDANPLIIGRSIVLINPKHTSSFLYSKNQFYQSLKEQINPEDGKIYIIYGPESSNIEVI